MGCAGTGATGPAISGPLGDGVHRSAPFDPCPLSSVTYRINDKEEDQLSTTSPLNATLEFGSSVSDIAPYATRPCNPNIGAPPSPRRRVPLAPGPRGLDILGAISASGTLYPLHADCMFPHTRLKVIIIPVDYIGQTCYPHFSLMGVYKSSI